jgi:hypothetical protein
MIVKLSEKEIEQSKRRRGLVYKEAYKIGLAKLLACITQKRPDGDGLPYLLLPHIEEVRGLFFAIGVGCGKYDCEACWNRNVCMAELLLKLKQHLVKYNRKQINIGEIIEKGTNGVYKIGKKYAVVIDILRRYILKLGGVEINVVD